MGRGGDELIPLLFSGSAARFCISVAGRVLCRVEQMPPANVGEGGRNRRRESDPPLLSSRAGGGIYSSQGEIGKRENKGGGGWREGLV